MAAAARYVLAVDALPGDEIPVDAVPLSPVEFVAYDALMSAAYASTPSELVASLVPDALRCLARRGYDAVIALPSTAVARAPLDPFFEALETADVVPDPDFDAGWWGMLAKSGRSVMRRHPADAEMVVLRGAGPQAVGRASVVLVDGDPPPAASEDVSAALRTAADPSAELAVAYRRLWSDANAGESGPPYRYVSFSNGVAFDDVCRALLRAGIAAGERFDDPDDVRAPASFFGWLASPFAPGRRLSRYLERYVALRPALRRAFPRCGTNPDELLAYLRERRPDDLDPVWYDADARAARALGEPIAGTAGVNVVGYFRAELGIGEAGRSLANALRSAGVPNAVLDFSVGSSNRSGDRTIEQFHDQPHHDITVLCANPDQYGVFDLHSAAAAFSAPRYRIGAWWFELPDLPPSWLREFARVDEVWAGSRFVEAAIARVAPVPVTYIPPIVEPRPTAPVSRSEFGLDDDDLVFLFTFDFNSVWER
ncbi:MAG TPA: hypothetical protein VGN14_15225, partial [Candidatus Elarobacter sp.]